MKRLKIKTYFSSISSFQVKLIIHIVIIRVLYRLEKIVKLRAQPINSIGYYIDLENIDVNTSLSY